MDWCSLWQWIKEWIPLLSPVAAFIALIVSACVYRGNRKRDLMPIIVFSLRNSAWEVENVGKGPAMDIVIGDDVGNGKDFDPVIEYYPMPVAGRVSLKSHPKRALKFVINYTDVWGTSYSRTCAANRNYNSSRRDRKLLKKAFENARQNQKLVKAYQLNREQA